MAPGRTPVPGGRRASPSRRRRARCGRSHCTCSATVGHTPVNACTCAASASFSSSVTAAAGCRNLPNLVPVSANPQDGSSMVNRSSAAEIRAAKCSRIAAHITRTQDGIDVPFRWPVVFCYAKHMGVLCGQKHSRIMQAFRRPAAACPCWLLWIAKRLATRIWSNPSSIRRACCLPSARRARPCRCVKSRPAAVYPRAWSSVCSIRSNAAA